MLITRWKLPAHHGATTKPVNVVVPYQGFMPRIVNKNRQATVLQD